MPTFDNQTKNEILLTLSSSLNHTDDFDQRLQSIVNAAAELTQSKGGAILLFEEETQQLAFAAVFPDNRENSKSIRVPVDKSVAGRVYRENAAVSIADLQSDPNISQMLEKFHEVAARNLLAVPIIFDQAGFGTLEVFSKSKGLDYALEDQNTLELLAAYAGVVIHTRRAEEEAMRVAHERIELNQQKTDFIAIASHELRTPLGLVLGHATFLRELIYEPIYQNQLDVIIRNAQRMKGIIDNLSQVENFENGTASIRWEHVDLRTILMGVIQTYQQEAAERAIAISVSGPPEIIQIHCDPAKLGVAIGNVVKNAIIFSDMDQPVQLSLEKLPGHVKISVIDTGVGIPTEDLHRIFERFYQVEDHLTRTRGGMGLGLSVTKAIVESHGGQIWVESTLGEGSIFTILLPIDNPSK